METQLSDAQPGTLLEGVYLARRHRALQTRTGSTYYALEVVDQSATLQARLWSPESGWPDGLTLPAFVRVRARVESFREEVQLNIEWVKPEEPSPERIAALVPASPWPADHLMQALEAHLDASIRTPALRRMLDAVLGDPDLREALKQRPAATANHHAYRTGLLEHTLSMMRVASLLAAHYNLYYPGLVSEELVVAGALLHDLGKCWELEGDLEPDYSTAGRLVGHIPMMAMHLDRVAKALGDIPEPLVMELQHLVLSHHGEYEYGSPRRPKTAEAQLLHYVDNVDARMAIFAQNLPDDGWSSFVRIMGRPLFAPRTERNAWQSPSTVEERRPDGPGLPHPTLTPNGPTAASSRGNKSAKAKETDETDSQPSLFDPQEPA